MARAFDNVPTHLQRFIQGYCNLPPFQARLVWTQRDTKSKGIAVCGNNNVFTTVSHSVVVRSIHNTLLKTWDTSDYAVKPCGVAVTPENEVIMSDCDQHCLHVLTPTGTFVRIIGSAGTADGLLWNPIGVAATKTGHVLVADFSNQRIQMFRVSDGAFVRKWGTKGSADGEFNGPVALCVTPDHHVLVTEYCNHRVQMFTMEGVFVRKWGACGGDLGFFNRPGGIAIRGHEVLVCDRGHGRVQVFRLDGTFVRAWMLDDDGKALFREPMSVAVTRQGHVLVGNYGNACLQMFE